MDNKEFTKELISIINTLIIERDFFKEILDMKDNNNCVSSKERTAYRKKFIKDIQCRYKNIYGEEYEANKND